MDEDNAKGCFFACALVFLLVFVIPFFDKHPKSFWWFVGGFVICCVVGSFWVKTGVAQLAKNIQIDGYDQLFITIIIKIAENEGNVGMADELAMYKMFIKERPGNESYEKTVKRYIHEAKQSETELNILLNKFKARFDDEIKEHLLYAISQTLLRHNNNKQYVRKKISKFADILDINRKIRRNIEDNLGITNKYDSCIELLILIAMKFSIQNGMNFDMTSNAVIDYIYDDFPEFEQEKCKLIISESRKYEYSLDELIEKFYENKFRYSVSPLYISPVHIIAIFYKIVHSCNYNIRKYSDYILKIAAKFDISPERISYLEQKYK